jgi:di/tricarboxylate transporter
MTGEMMFIFALVVAAAGLLASNRIGFDVVALLVIVTLMLSGIMTVEESLSGFGNPVVILIASLLVIGEMLDRTGVARAVGNFILKKGGQSEGKLLVLIMLMAAVLSSLMSSTAVVAVFIPIVVRIASNTGLNRSSFLMPMALAAMISGLLTLIATPPNLVIHEALRQAGYEGFSFFSFAPIGLMVLLLAIIYMLTIGRKLLSKGEKQEEVSGADRSINELFEGFRGKQVYEVYQIGPTAKLANQRIGDSGIKSEFNLWALGIQRRGRMGENIFIDLNARREIKTNDHIVTLGLPENHEKFLLEPGISKAKFTSKQSEQWLWEMGGAVVLIHPESSLIGKSIKQLKFKDRFGLQVLGLRRNKGAIEDFENTELRDSDSLFVGGKWERINNLNIRSREFIVMEEAREKQEIIPAFRKLPIALLILSGLIAASVFNIVPLAAASIIAGLTALFTRCLTMEDAYRAIHWKSLVLIAGMLPLASALEKTGGIELIASTLLNGLGDAGPKAILSALFLVTASISLILSNTASAVLVAPIALTLAKMLEVSPYPLCLAVLIGASSAFATPISSPVVTLVVEPGRYRFMDFVKVGLPLMGMVWLVMLLMVPLLYPF